MQKVLKKIHKGNEIYKASFKKFDVDGNGFIDRDELQHVLNAGGKKRVSESQINEMFDEADLDGDGQLSFNGNIVSLLTLFGEEDKQKSKIKLLKKSKLRYKNTIELGGF